MNDKISEQMAEAQEQTEGLTLNDLLKQLDEKEAEKAPPPGTEGEIFTQPTEEEKKEHVL